MEVASASLEAHYDQLSEQFFSIYYTYHPSHATRQGLHQFDNHLGHYHRSEIEETLRDIKQVQRQLSQIDPTQMDHDHALDYAVLQTRIKREIYWIETWRFWENNPLFYKDAITEGIFNLVGRDFAPLDERLQLVISRERDIPDVLQAARENLHNPPREYTELAIRFFDGAKLFFRGIVQEFASVDDPALVAAFQASNNAALAEIDSFVAWLREDLLPRSHGSFAVGTAGIQAILDCEEMIDVPVEDILKRCYDDLAKTEAAIAELTRKIDPAATPDELRERMRDNHPSADDLLPAMRRELARMRGFLVDRNLMTIPPELPEVIVSPIPPYSSAGGMMLTPGPFETRATEAYLAINLPQPDWPAERVERQLRDFNYYSMMLLFSHESYPGHHTQFFLEKRVPLRASKDHDSDSNSDGWADYGKRMLVEEAYGELDPLYYLADLQATRSSIVAAIAGMEIHMGRRTLDQAADFIASASGRPREMAFRLLDRAVYYPTHLTYYIGSEMMRKLRDDYRALRGSDWSLREFHDRFMSYGLIPIKLIRADMLGAADDGILF
jgi:uncharacterized protein (DUF885 family)